MINKVILVGRLGKEPEVRTIPSGTEVCTFSVATDEKFTDRSGEKQVRTEWHNIKVWGKLAGICGQYLHKGQLVYLEGSIRTESWDDKESGQKKYRTEIIAHVMKMLGRSESSGSSGGSGYSAQSSSASSSGESWEDEEVPF